MQHWPWSCPPCLATEARKTSKVQCTFDVLRASVARQGGQLQVPMLHEYLTG